MQKEKKWYAMYTKSRWEKQVHQELEAKGIEVYLPLLKTLRQWSDRKKWVEEPLFRSYIFVHITPKEYDLAIKTPGVVKYITFEGRAIPIPPQQIEAVKAYINEGDARIEYSDKYEIGDMVEIKIGAMRGLKGRLMKIKGKHRVLVEISGIGERIILNVPKSYLYIR